MRTDTCVRYGVYVPQKGFIASQLWEGPRFGDAGKSLSYIDKEDAVSLWEQAREKYPAAELSTLTITVTAVMEKLAPASERYKQKVAEYNELKARYDAMTHKEVDKLTISTWNYYTKLKHTLQSYNLI